MEALLLDLDDTLMADGHAIDEALAAAWSTVASSPAVDPRAAAVTVRAEARALWRTGPYHAAAQELGVSSWEPLWAALRQAVPGVPGLGEWLPGYRAEAWRRALVRLEADLALAAPLSARFREERLARCAPFPGVAALLRELRGRLRLAVVTNGMPELQREKLRASGLAELVDVVVVSGDVGTAKPDPRVFAAALDALGVPAAAAVMVGDNLARDVGGAAALGMRTVWVSGGRTLPEDGARPSAVVEHASLLETALATL